jgi:predicted ATPase
MVGRKRQRQLLADALEQAIGERVCQLFTVLGSAGVGKSRLVNEFLAGLSPDVRVLRGRCLSYGRGITFWPIREMLLAAAGIGDDDTQADAHAKLSAMLPADEEADAGRILDRVAEAIGLAEGTADPDDTFRSVRRLFEALAHERPLVLVFDDVHWAEPSLLDLIEDIADWSREAPILLLCIGRQELLEVRPTWGGGKLAATTIQLEPLSVAESDELVVSLLGRADLDVEVRRRIAEAADGNPLFVEELLGMLIDDGWLVREDGGWSAARDLRRITVPPTIPGAACGTPRPPRTARAFRHRVWRRRGQGFPCQRRGGARPRSATVGRPGASDGPAAQGAAAAGSVRVQRRRGVSVPASPHSRRGLRGHAETGAGGTPRALRGLAGGRRR